MASAAQKRVWFYGSILTLVGIALHFADSTHCTHTYTVEEYRQKASESLENVRQYEAEYAEVEAKASILTDPEEKSAALDAIQPLRDEADSERITWRVYRDKAARLEAGKKW